MTNIEKKIMSIGERYDALALETNLAIIAMAEQGIKRIEPEEAINNDFFITDFRGDDCAFCGLKINQETKEVEVIVIHVNGAQAHTIQDLPLKYVSTEDKFYLTKYISKILETN